MEIIKSLLSGLKLAMPSAVALAAVLVILFVVRLILDKRYAKTPGYQFRRQVITLALSFIGFLVVIMVLPISDTTRGQLLSLIGILLSAAIALSSATLIGNAMAGIMLRAVRNFRPGDFISVGDHFGRVSERGLFHVEIQTEHRDLTTIPNLYLATHPVKVIRTSGTIVSAEVSLGYDLPHGRIRDLLTEAAQEAGLDDPFVHITRLGDFSVTYRAAGMLSDIKHLISTRSRLREMMLDKLHEGGVEIVSPTFMNTRALATDQRFIPPVTETVVAPAQREAAPEKLAFDKADEAESLERLREMFTETAGRIDDLKKKKDDTPSEAEKQKLQNDIEQTELRRDRLAEIIKAREQKEK